MACFFLIASENVSRDKKIMFFSTKKPAVPERSILQGRFKLFFFFLSRSAGISSRRWQFDALLNMKMLSKALIFKLCTAVTPWIGIEVAWVVTQGGSS